MARATAVAVLALSIAVIGNAQQRFPANSGLTAPSAPHMGVAAHSGVRAPSSFTTPGRRPGTLPLGRGYLPAHNLASRRAPSDSRFRAPDLRSRYPFQPGYRRNADRGGRDRDRYRHDYRGHHNYAGRGGYYYPTWVYPYPWVNSFTLSGWDDSDYAAPDASTSAQDYAQDQNYAPAPPYADAPYAEYNGYSQQPAPPPYPAQQSYPQKPAPMAPESRPATSVSSTAFNEPLTIIFKDGRTPEKMQNYMMNGTTLTNLDPQHYEQIPLDLIDVDATAKLNRAHGVNFQVPDSSGE